MANGTTKAVNLTEDEIKDLIISHGRELGQYDAASEPAMQVSQHRIERINYLSKRLKSFSEPEKMEAQSEEKAGPAPTTAAAGW